MQTNRIIGAITHSFRQGYFRSDQQIHCARDTVVKVRHVGLFSTRIVVLANEDCHVLNSADIMERENVLTNNGITYRGRVNGKKKFDVTLQTYPHVVFIWNEKEQAGTRIEAFSRDPWSKVGLNLYEHKAETTTID